MIGHDDIEYASLTDVGLRRSHNQDAHVALPAGDRQHWHERGHVFLVADGMGAHAVGELASKLAVDSIPHIYSKHAHEGPLPALRKAFVEANTNIHTRGQQNREFEGMGTTATALVLRNEGAWIGHVGDSRVYRIRDGQIEQLSFDHSLVWELARRQHIEPEELQGIPSNVIVRSLGPEALVQVDVEGPHPVRAGDIYVLCSDGLSGPLTDPEIGAVASALPPVEACRLLIDLANLHGGPDNITALVVRILGEGESDPAKAPPPAGFWPPQIHWPLAALVGGVLLAAGAVALTYAQLAGGMVLFVLAAVALFAGLGGLLWTHRHENNRLAEELDDEPRAPQVYRQSSCRVDTPLLDKFARAVTQLEQRIRERDWQADFDDSHVHRELAEKHMRGGALNEAFREYCRALRTLTEAVQRQRGKEESFKPLWDKNNDFKAPGD